MNWYIFGGKTCEYLTKFIQSPGLIFSIISDDRIPDEVISFLKLYKFNTLKINIHILGDLFDLPLEQWRVRNNLLPWLDSQHITADVFWYDGDLIRGINHLKPIHCDPKKITSSEISRKYNRITSCHHYEVDKIFEILGYYPYYELDSRGQITHLNFKGDGFNDLGIMSQLRKNETKEIFYLISQMHSLKILNISFTKNLEITALPENLVKLDCRGSFNLKFETELPKNLSYLNIAACGLKEIPEVALNHDHIKILLLYKNFISEINDLYLPKNIERLSLYRNNICHINWNIDNLQYLTNLNLGANPLSELTFISNYYDRDLILNIRKINSAKLIYSIPQNLNIKIEN